MSRYSSIIDEALAQAHDRMGLTKAASAPEETDLIKEAEDLAGALEFISLGTVNDGTAAGAAGHSMLSAFFKEAGKGTSPAESVTAGGGSQPPVPASGKTHIPTASGGDRPATSVASDGKLSRDAMAMQPPAVTTSPTQGTGKKAAAPTLWDIIENFDTDASKTAAKGGPADSVALDNQAAPPGRQENSNIDLLRSNTAPVAATKRQAKAPTRERLKKLWAGASDTTGDATARAIWPNAASKGSLKIAADAEVEKEAKKEVSRKEYEHQAFNAIAKPLSEDSGKIRRYLHGKQIAPTTAEYQAHMAKNPEGGFQGLGRGLKRIGIGAGVGGALGAAGGALAAGKGRRREGALVGANLGAGVGVAAGAAHDNVKTLKATLKQHDGFMSGKGLTTESTKAKGLRGFLGGKDTKYYSKGSSEKKASVAEYSQLFGALLEGAAGEELQSFAQHIEGQLT